MKLLITYLTLIALACNSAKVSNDYRLEEFGHNELKLIYQAHTRGFFEEVSVTEKSIVFIKNRKRTKPINGSITFKEWKACIDLVDTIDLKSISQLTAPSDLRKTDRVAYAQLTVIRKGDTLKSSDFDHKNPPKELKELVDHILSLKEN
jgi:heat shock protein HslJ